MRVRACLFVTVVVGACRLPPAPAAQATPDASMARAAAPTTPTAPIAPEPAANNATVPSSQGGVQDAGTSLPPPGPLPLAGRYVGQERFVLSVPGLEAPPPSTVPGETRIAEAPGGGNRIIVTQIDSDRGGEACVFNATRNGSVATLDPGQSCRSTERSEDALTLTLTSGTITFGRDNRNLTFEYAANLTISQHGQAHSGSLTYRLAGDHR